MKKPVYPEDSLKHIECSIIAYNGYSPIKNYKSDDNFLESWRARQLQIRKFRTVKAYDAEVSKSKDGFYRITKKLRNNIDNNRAGELKAFGFFKRYYGLTREEITQKLDLEKNN